jgi:hypothetical protein
MSKDAMKILALVGHSKCGSTFIDRAIRGTGNVTVMGSYEVANWSVDQILETARHAGKPLYLYHQNAIQAPEYLNKIKQVIGRSGTAIMVYRNPIDASLSLVRQVLQGMPVGGDRDVGLNRPIRVTTKSIENIVHSFLGGELRDIVDDRYNYVENATILRSNFSEDQFSEYLFENLTTRPTEVVADILGHLDMTINAAAIPSRAVNVSYTPRSRLIYRLTNAAYARVTGRDSSELRRSVTEPNKEGWRGAAIFRQVYRLNRRPSSNWLSPGDRREILAQLPFSLQEFGALTGLPISKWT